MSRGLRRLEAREPRVVLPRPVPARHALPRVRALVRIQPARRLLFPETGPVQISEVLRVRRLPRETGAPRRIEMAANLSNSVQFLTCAHPRRTPITECGTFVPNVAAPLLLQSAHAKKSAVHPQTGCRPAIAKRDLCAYPKCVRRAFMAGNRGRYARRRARCGPDETRRNSQHGARE